MNDTLVKAGSHSAALFFLSWCLYILSVSLWPFLSPLITKVLFIVALVFSLSIYFSSLCQNMNYSISHYLLSLSLCFTAAFCTLWWHLCFCASSVPHKKILPSLPGSSGLSFGQSTTLVQTDVSQQLLDRLPLHFVQIFMVPIG